MIGRRKPGWGADWGSPGQKPAQINRAHSDAEAAELVAAAHREGSDVAPIELLDGDLARTLGIVSLQGASSSIPGVSSRRSSPHGVSRRRAGISTSNAGVSSRRAGISTSNAGVSSRRAGISTSNAGVSSRRSSSNAGVSSRRSSSIAGVSSRRTPVEANTDSRTTCVIADAGQVLINEQMHWFTAHLVARRSWWRGRVIVVANASFMGGWNIAPRAHPGDGRLDVLDTCAPISVRWAARHRLPSGTHVPHPKIAQRRVTETHFNLDPALDIYLDGAKVGRASSFTIKVKPSALEIWL